MNIGIIGLPQTGKKTLFKLLVGQSALDHHNDPRESARGVAVVQDERFDRLLQIYRPRKETRAQLGVVLIPKIEENVVAEGSIFRDIGEVEALCHVVRAFEDESVYHIWGRPDPAREIEFVQSELVLHDLLFVEKRLERIEKDLKKVKDETRQREQTLLTRFKEHLEGEKPLRLLAVSGEEARLIASYPLLTRSRMIVALNVSESQLADSTGLAELGSRFEDDDLVIVAIAVQAETDIAGLENEEERSEFRSEMGIEDTALHVLTSKFIEAVGLVSFFTAASNELRQWFVRRGSTAPQAAGVIHSDMERGFIRAEVAKYADIVELGSEEACKAAGKYYLKGKDYVVEDGDVIKIRFNV